MGGQRPGAVPGLPVRPRPPGRRRDRVQRHRPGDGPDGDVHAPLRLADPGRGDLHVHVEVRTPTRLDETQEKLLRELAELRNEDISAGGSRGGLFSKMRDAFGAR